MKKQSKPRSSCQISSTTQGAQVYIEPKAHVRETEQERERERRKSTSTTNSVEIRMSEILQVSEGMKER